MGKTILLKAPFEIPDTCCVCLQRATAMRSSKRSEYLPLGVAVQVKTQEFPIPFCEACLGKTNKKLKRYKTWMHVFFWAMIAFGFLASFFDKAGVSMVFIAMGAGSLVAAIYSGSQERRRAPVQLKKLTEKEAILECEIPEYADLLVKDVKEKEEGRGGLPKG